jgi:hypothetical protein
MIGRNRMLAGSSYQKHLEHMCRYVSHISNVNDHSAKSQALFPLYAIFFEFSWSKGYFCIS